jgi:hypothetical protein
MLAIISYSLDLHDTTDTTYDTLQTQTGGRLALRHPAVQRPVAPAPAVRDS